MKKPALWLGAMLVASVSLAATASASAPRARAFTGTATYTTVSNGPVAAAESAPSSRIISVPYWESSFTDPSNGATWSYRMVGTDPNARHAATTTVPTIVIPINFRFPSGAVLKGSDTIGATLASPIFRNAPFQNGTRTQYGNAIQKSMFWYRSGTSNQLAAGRSDYNVLLGSPEVADPFNVRVPANMVDDFDLPDGNHLALMDANYFDALTHQYMAAHHVSPRVLPIFIVNNVFMYDGTEDNCCILGWHGADATTLRNGSTSIQTYMFAAYSTPNVFYPNVIDANGTLEDESYIADIHALSHEVSEWVADPFTDNFVTPWLTPSAPQYGCTDWLETGDPVVGYGWNLPLSGRTYHPEDEAFYSWFARESPSRASNRAYTYLDTHGWTSSPPYTPWDFTQVAQGC